MKLLGISFVLSALLCSTQAFTAPLSRSDQGWAREATSLSALPDEKRVVVTGLGVISGCGIGANDFFQAICEGKSSIDKVKRFDIQYYPCQIGSEVPDEMFDANDYFVNPKNAKSNDRYTHFAVAAARLALKDAKLGDTPETLQNPERVGVMVGSAFGGMETFEKETLKLAQKPERPKVSAVMHACMHSKICWIVQCFGPLTKSLPVRSFLLHTLTHVIHHSPHNGRFHPLPSLPCWETRLRV